MEYKCRFLYRLESCRAQALSRCDTTSEYYLCVVFVWQIQLLVLRQKKVHYAAWPFSTLDHHDPVVRFRRQSLKKKSRDTKSIMCRIDCVQKKGRKALVRLTCVYCAIQSVNSTKMCTIYNFFIRLQKPTIIAPSLPTHQTNRHLQSTF